MNIQRAIFDRLTNGTVSDVVGDRIYGEFAPHNATMPFIIYTLDRADTEIDLDGGTDFGSAEFTVICFADTLDAVFELSFGVRRDLQDWNDELASPEIRWCTYVETLDGSTIAPERSEKRRFRKDVFFKILFEDKTADTF